MRANTQALAKAECGAEPARSRWHIGIGKFRDHAPRRHRTIYNHCPLYRLCDLTRKRWAPAGGSELCFDFILHNSSFSLSLRRSAWLLANAFGVDFIDWLDARVIIASSVGRCENACQWL